MSDTDDLLREFVDMVDAPLASDYLAGLAKTQATQECMVALLRRFEQKIQRLEALQAVSPRVIAKQMLAVTRVSGKMRRVDPGLLDGWKKVDNTGQPVALGSPDGSAVRDYGARLEWTVKSDRLGDWPHPRRQVTWREANSLLLDLNCLSGSVRRDWRLPTISELAALMETSDRHGEFLISDELFPDVVGDGMYWSSTMYEDTQYLQMLRFKDGELIVRSAGKHAYLRFVRSFDDNES